MPDPHVGQRGWRPGNGPAPRLASAALRALQLLCLAPPRGLAQEAQQLSSDFLTLRYHGRYPERFSRAKIFPEEVCSTFAAACADIRLWECLANPPEVRVPWLVRAEQGELSNWRLAAPREDGGGGHLLLARSEFRARGRQLVLWSGCNATCGDCLAGTGQALVIEELPMCVATKEGGVFGLLYNDNFGHLSTHRNCWNSLSEYDEETERQARIQMIVKYSAFGAVALVGCSIGCLIVCYRCHCKRRREIRRDAPAEGSGPQPRTIGQATIEKVFPPGSSTNGGQCAVCLVTIEEDQPCRSLQCGHEFHAECIAGWWTHVPRATLECPLCKRRQDLGEGAGAAPAARAEGEATPVAQGEREVSSLSDTSAVQAV